MIKRITALTMAIVMLLGISAFAATFSDVAANGECADAINVLSELGIITGMGDGTFSPDTSLTRAQFAKMAVWIMGKTKEAVATTDAFSDVKSADWYSGYVNVVAKEGVITGYPDGSFGANDAVTYAQAITIIVRLLGYNAADVGHKWPQGYIDKANVLSLTDGLSFSANDIITREKAALLIYRALFTDLNGTKSALITKMDKNVYEDAVILATKNENTALLANQVQSDKGIFTYDAAVSDMAEYLGYEGTLVVGDESDVIAFVPESDMSFVKHTVAAVYKETNSDSVSVITEENKTVNINNKTTIYMGGGTYTAAKLAEGITPGSTITLFNEKGSLKYAFVDEYKYAGPKTVLSTSMVERLFSIKDKSSLKVVRKGLSASIDDIQIYDVLYYSERTNTIYAYADRVTGIYEEAYPMKSNVSRVTVSGKEYSLSTIEAINKLNESKTAFNIGDRVTLLLGKDGDVIDVVSLTEDLSMFGVITATGSEISDDDDARGRTEYYVELMLSDGSEVKYLVKDDSYSDDAGRLCEIDFENGYAVLDFPDAVIRSGEIDKDKKTMGTEVFASDYAILEYVSGNESRATVMPLTLSDIDGTKILRGDVKHVEFNQKGEIILLYLDNVSGNGSVYGVLVEVPDTKPGVYTILSGGSKHSVTGAYYTSFAKGDGVEYRSDGKIYAMTKIASGNSITSLTDNIIKLGGKSYTVADSVTVYAGKYASELKTISLEDALSISGSIVFYSDRSVAEGGKVRVIRITTG